MLIEEVCLGNVGTEDTKIGRVPEASFRGDKRVAAMLDPDTAGDGVDKLAASLGVSIACTMVVAGRTTVAVPSTEETLPRVAKDWASSCLVWRVEFPICRVPPDESAWEGTIMRVGVEPASADRPVLVLTKTDEVGRIASCPLGGTRVEARLVCGVEEMLGLAT